MPAFLEERFPLGIAFGATGGPKYGLSNHFIPAKPFSKVLWPGNWPKKVWHSDFGIVAMVAGSESQQKVQW